MKLLRIACWTVAAFAGFVVVANLLYFAKTEAGIKLTDEPHHGWLFPIAQKGLNRYGYPKKPGVRLHLLP